MPTTEGGVVLRVSRPHDSDLIFSGPGSRDVDRVCLEYGCERDSTLRALFTALSTGGDLGPLGHLSPELIDGGVQFR